MADPPANAKRSFWLRRKPNAKGSSSTPPPASTLRDSAGPVPLSASSTLVAPSRPPLASALQTSSFARSAIRGTASAGWSGLKRVLSTLRDATDAFPALKSVVGGLLGLIDAFEKASNAHADFETLVRKVEELRSLVDGYTPATASQAALGEVQIIAHRIEQLTQDLETKWSRSRRLAQRVLTAEEDQRVIKTINEALSHMHAIFTIKAVRRIESDTHNLVKRSDDSADNAILAKLRPVLQAHTPKDGAVPCMDDTRTDVLADLMAWATDRASEHILWLDGMAGMGKTAISVSLRNKLKVKGLLGGSFFCSRDDPERRDVWRIIPTMVHGMAQVDTGFRASLLAKLKEMENVEDIHDRTFLSAKDRLSILLCRHPVRPAKSGDPQVPVFVIDALDECAYENDTSDGNNPISEFLTVLEKLSKDCSVKFFITSRPEPRISNVLERSPATLWVRLQEYDAKADIKTYLSQLLSGWIDADSLNQLAELSDGLFIYAATVQKFLKLKSGKGVSKKRLEHLLDPKTRTIAMGQLDTLYDIVLDQAFQDLVESEASLLLKLLTLLPLLSEPLSAISLGFLLEEEPEEIGIALQNLHSVLQIPPDEDVSSCITEIHSSFYEYLKEPIRAGRSLIERLHRDHPERIHWSTNLQQVRASQYSDLAGNCLRILDTELVFNVTQSVSSHLPNSVQMNSRASSDHLRYVCKYWTDHLLAALQPTSISSHARTRSLLVIAAQLLRKSFLFWLEVMSVMECVPLALVLLRKIAKYLNTMTHEQPDELDLSGFINDAIDFLDDYYEPISVSAPHIYLSALPFTRPRSQVAREFRQQFQSTLVTTDAVSTLSRIPPASIRRRVSSLLQKTQCATKSSIGEEKCMTLRGHGDSVTSVAFSPDGKRIVSGSRDETIRIWDTEIGGEVCAPLMGHEDSINCVAVSPDGKQIASGSDDMTIRVWDIDTGREACAPLRQHTSSVSSVAFSPDGKQIASGSWDKTIRVWDTETGKETCAPITLHKHWVNSVSFSPDGKWIISGSNDKTIRVWDIKTGTEICTPITGDMAKTDRVLSVAFSSDGSKIVSGSCDNIVRVWDIHTRQTTLLTGHENWITSVAFSPDGKRIVSASDDDTIRIWDVETGEETRAPLRGHEDSVNSVAFSPDGKRIASASLDRTIRLWDIEADGISSSLRDRVHPVGANILSPEAGVSDWTIVSNAETGEEICAPHLPIKDPVNSVAFSPDGKRIVSGSADAGLRIWDAETGREICALREHEDSIKSVAFSPDGKRIVSGSGDKTIRLWIYDTPGASSMIIRGHEDIVRSVAFSPDGKRIASGSDDMTIRVWDAETGEATLAPFRGHEDCVTSVAFSPDGKWIVSGSEYKTIRVWDVETGREICAPLEGHRDWVSSVAFSPDGEHIVSGSHDKTVRLWNVGTWDEMCSPIVWPDGLITSVAFSPDGTRIVAAAWDAKIRVWETETQREVFPPLVGHERWVNSVAFSPHGKRLVSGSDDHTIRVWDAETWNAETEEGSDSYSSPLSPPQGGSSRQQKLFHTHGVTGVGAYLEMKKGWIMGPNNELLLYVPSEHRSGLWWPRTRLVIGAERQLILDMTRFVHGTEWTKCCTAGRFDILVGSQL